MSYRTLSPRDQATLFCLSVVRAHWPQQVPTLGEATEEFGVSRKQAPRMRRRFFAPLVALLENTNRPGPRPLGDHAQAVGRRMALLEALLALARGVIVSAGIAGLAPYMRENVIRAIEGLHASDKVGCVKDVTARRPPKRDVNGNQGLLGV